MRGLDLPDGPSFLIEQRLGVRVAGTDEAGRGAWVGPVVAAAVVLDPAHTPPGINDSKKIPKARRAALYDQIMTHADVGVGQASVEEIDTTNILTASFLAMRRAVAALATPPEHVLVDGNQNPRIGLPTSCIVRGDALSLSIAAASIVAKVTRDRIIAEAAREYPDFGWDRNAGYGTAQHRRALELVGITPLHRKSFSPIRKLMTQES
ncbi:MAG: ribonuclease HII [Alphaproteobacteria bacterium]|nr:MAG: ribonuclease HII [Alphaproteobacteria bacterium]